MTCSNVYSLGVVALCLGTGAAMAATDLPLPQSTTVLEFADANTLFVADSVGSQIFAYTLDGIPNTTDAVDSKPYNIAGLGQRLAKALDVTPFAITYHDLAVHPVTRHAFVSMSVAGKQGPKPAIAKIDIDGDVLVLDLKRLQGSVQSLTDAAADDVTFWREIPASTLTVTDLDFANGELFVAGVSTGEFASTLRRVPYPFKGAYATTSVEMYHTAHNQNETRAPIRAMTFARLDGVPSIVAAYTCTPLVTVPVAALKDGAHVSGKTIAELGLWQYAAGGRVVRGDEHATRT